MKFSAILLGAALYLFSSVEAGISTNTPFKSVTWNGGAKETVAWADDGKAPKLADIGLTSVDLMAGGNNSQVPVANIGKVLATAKTIDFTVPKNVGPPGDFYFIKYTAGQNTFFSGSFSIQNVNGKINGFDPKNPNPIKAVNAPANATAPTNVTAPVTGSPNTGYPSTGGYPNAGSPSPNPAGGSTPPSSPTPSVPAAPASPAAPTANAASLPNSISSDASNSFPSFAGVAAAAIAFAFTYLY